MCCILLRSSWCLRTPNSLHLLSHHQITVTSLKDKALWIRSNAQSRHFLSGRVLQIACKHCLGSSCLSLEHWKWSAVSLGSKGTQNDHGFLLELLCYRTQISSTEIIEQAGTLQNLYLSMPSASHALPHQKHFRSTRLPVQWINLQKWANPDSPSHLLASLWTSPALCFNSPPRYT